jgi:hypothetical protein
MRQAQGVCNEHEDVASIGPLDNFIDQAEKVCAISLRNQPKRRADAAVEG